ncbi:MAG: hypothetical protein MUE50_18840, partial [Pirellulaceae bacterium]|nr:hypothetical protein [Pirellulaceae bacterium]
ADGRSSQKKSAEPDRRLLEIQKVEPGKRTTVRIEKRQRNWIVGTKPIMLCGAHKQSTALDALSRICLRQETAGIQHRGQFVP